AAAVHDTVPRVGVGRMGFAALLGTDPPEHTRLRQAVASMLPPQRVKPMRAGIRSLADKFAERTFAGPPPVDLMTAVCYPLALAVMCQKMGVPAGDEAFLRGTSSVLASRA